MIQTTENEGEGGRVEGAAQTLSGLRYWVLVSAGNGPTEVLTLGRDGEEVLPVFSHEEEAEMYLRLGGLGDAWRVVGSRAGGVISVLYGLRPDTSAVALDPLPTMIGEGTVGLVCLPRARFVKGMMIRERLLALRGPGQPSLRRDGAGSGVFVTA